MYSISRLLLSDYLTTSNVLAMKNCRQYPLMSHISASPPSIKLTCPEIATCPAIKAVLYARSGIAHQRVVEFFHASTRTVTGMIVIATASEMADECRSGSAASRDSTGWSSMARMARATSSAMSSARSSGGLII